MSTSLGYPHVSSPDFLIPDLQEFLFTGTFFSFFLFFSQAL